jgi:CRP/FNR family cyclic AMP-dependent transcriptional regulator
MATTQVVTALTLRTLSIFAGTSEPALQALAGAAELRPVERNATVIATGERADCVYLVLAGRLNVSVADAQGREAILSVLGPGELVGEMGVLDDGVSSATVKAACAAVLVVMAKPDFLRCLEQNFDVAHYVMRKLIQRLRVANGRIESLALLDVSERVTRVLGEMAETVSGVRVVTRKLSKRDIAKMIGASREMVSRCMRDLELRGLVQQTGGWITLRAVATPMESGRC